MPEELAWKLLEIGRVVDPPKTALLYAPLQQKEPYQGVKTERDVKYGPRRPPSARRLHAGGEFIRPAGADLLHGGGFVGGNKHPAADTARGSPFYDNVMLWAVKNGFVGVNATYRLRTAVAMAGGRRRPRRGRSMGFGQDRRARRRSRAHLSDGSIGRRGSCRKLCLAS